MSSNVSPTRVLVLAIATFLATGSACGGGDASPTDASAADASSADAAADAAPPLSEGLAIRVGGDTWGEIWYSINGSEAMRCLKVGDECRIAAASPWTIDLYALTLSDFGGFGMGCSGLECRLSGSGVVNLAVNFTKAAGEVYTTAVSANTLEPAVDGEPMVRWAHGGANNVAGNVTPGAVFPLSGGRSATFSSLGDPELGDDVWTVSIKNAAGNVLGSAFLDGRYHHRSDVGSDGCACISSAGNSRVELGCGPLDVNARIAAATSVVTTSTDYVENMIAVKSCSQTAWGYELARSNVTGIHFAGQSYPVTTLAQTSLGPVALISVGAGTTTRSAVVDMGSELDRTRVMTVRRY